MEETKVIINGEGPLRNNEQEISWKDAYSQIKFSAVAFLLTTHAGINMSYTNLLTEYVGTDELSWIASIATLTTPIGALMSGPLADNIGRRNTHIAIGVPCVLSWLIFALGDITQLYLFMIARILAGVAGGLSTVTIIYVSEIAHGTYRPMLLSLLSVFISFGILLTSIVGAFLDWKTSAIVFTCSFTAITVLIIFYIPESPQWTLYFRPNEMEKAKNCVKTLYPKDEIFKQEWQILEQNVRKRKSGSMNCNNNWKFSDPDVYKPFIILLIMLFLQQISGAYSAIFYTKKMLPLICKGTEGKSNEEIFLLLGIVRFVASIITCVVSKNYGRRQVLLTSSCILAVLCLILAIFIDNGSQTAIQNQGIYLSVFSAYNIINIGAFVCYVGVSAIGVLNIPWTLMAELLPISVKGIGISFLISYTYVLLFTVTKLFPFMLDSILINHLFLFFGIVSVIITIFTYLYLPETLGKNFNEISRHFHSNSRPAKTKTPLILKSVSSFNPVVESPNVI